MPRSFTLWVMTLLNSRSERNINHPLCGCATIVIQKINYNQLKEDIRDILKQLCSYKGVEIIEGHLMPDHIHMLVSIPPKMSVSSYPFYGWRQLK